MTSTDTLTLAAFLGARLDEDEARATAAAKLGYHQVVGWAKWDDDYGGHFTYDRDPWDENTNVAGSPARVLADVAAKRRIVDIHPGAPNEDDSGSHCITCEPEGWPCSTLRTLAAVYADHPDYREEWAL